MRVPESDMRGLAAAFAAITVLIASPARAQAPSPSPELSPAAEEFTPTPTPVPAFTDIHDESEEELRHHLMLARRNHSCVGALTHARELLVDHPDDLDALHTVEECSRADESEAGESAAQFIQNSKILSLVPELLDLAGVKDVIPIINQVETKTNKSVADYLMLNEFYEKLGQPDKQIRFLEEAIAADPNDPRPKLLLASKKWDDGDRHGARTLYREYFWSARHHPGQIYLLTYVATLSYPPLILILLAGVWGLGFLAVRRSRERIEFVYGEFKAGAMRRALPWIGALVPLLLAVQFWSTGKALPFGLLIVMIVAGAAVIVVPPVLRRLKPVFALIRRGVSSLFTERFARAMARVPPGYRILIALASVFVIVTVVPIVEISDLRYALLFMSALTFYGTIGSLIVTLLRNSESLRTSLRWLGFAATLPFFAIYVYRNWSEIGAPMMHARLPSSHAFEDLLRELATWLITVVFSLHLSRILADALVEPVRLMMKRVASIEHGDFKSKVDVVSRDELGALAEAVNRMAEGLERREFVEKTFSRYVDKQVAAKILSGDTSEIRIAGQRMKAVVLFSDIRGFTKMSENMTPEQVVTILNDYFEDMVGAIRAQGGVIDKFIGDAIMAVWGVPYEVPDAPRKAVAAAITMRDAMEKISAKFQAQGFPKIGIGIGINLGEVVAGTLGSKDKMEYTVIGDVVNTAQRGEANAMAQQILITEAVWKQVSEVVDAEALEGRLVKGKSEPVYFWSVRAMKDSAAEPRATTGA